MNRRSFLGGIAAALATAVLDPERALWVPGAKLISIPRPEPVSVEVHHTAFNSVLITDCYFRHLDGKVVLHSKMEIMDGPAKGKVIEQEFCYPPAWHGDIPFVAIASAHTSKFTRPSKIESELLPKWWTSQKS